jgi:Zn-dependent protease with chaperone function
LAKHLRPEPPTQQFDNVVTEIAIALVEPVESIQTYRCPVPNIAMLPCSDREIVVATTGALEKLSRYELQALVAAQFPGMRNRWCRMATRAEIMWWAIPWYFPIGFTGLVLGRPFAMLAAFGFIFVWAFMPRKTEQARDLCADVVAVRTTFDPQSLASAMRKLAGHAQDATKIDFGAWYLPMNPFLVIPKRHQTTTTVNGRSWNQADEVRLELLLRADRAEAMAKGGKASDFTGREFSRRWRKLGK